MRHLLNVFRRSFDTSLAVQVQYQAATVIWLLGGVLEPIIYLVVWSTVAQWQGGTVEGLGRRDFAAHYVVLMAVQHATFTWIMWEYEYLVRDGTLARRLMRPVHPVVGDLADNFAYKTIAGVALLPAVVLTCVFFEPRLDLGPAQVVAFVPALALAVVMRFCLEWALAMAAFWTTRITAINQTYFTAVLFLSGRLAPLELLPAPVQVLATVLPFRWMISFPIEVLLGKTLGMQIVWGFAAQLAWLVVGVAAGRFLWRAGLRQFSAVGS